MYFFGFRSFPLVIYMFFLIDCVFCGRPVFYFVLLSVPITLHELNKWNKKCRLVLETRHKVSIYFINFYKFVYFTQTVFLL